MPAYAGRANPNAPARKGHNQERRPARTIAHARPSKTQTEPTTGERTRVAARGFRLGRGRKRVPHVRARRKLLEIESLLDAVTSEVEASEERALEPGRSPGAEAEQRVRKLCEKVEKKAAEAALMGQRIVELHRQIDGCECR
ncbi:PREDICTED: putative MORF4 family-associated protein 1-like protein UPP [Ceratotherium simum simum]|uniref:MORF4 family-associated protein 1-like protein UPP n=1 Tax=Ceratotherium simum simum TaxID=73337 RepID=A0ABM1CXX1_CERSS|nr:PREDICTED: putative MORF4 family-associated protein 1-like protein UPP [Ceratotherium simum simum]